MTKKAISILLALLMCLMLFAACGNSEQVDTNAGSGGAGQTSSGNGSGQTSGGGADDEDMSEINVALMCLAPIDQNASAAVVDAVNEYTERDINVHVNITWFDAATYGTQIPMQIQAGEKLDVIMFTPVPGASYTSYRSANQLMDISGYLEEYGQTILATEGDLIKGTSYGGAIYGITHYATKTGFETLYVRKDLADAAGVTADLQNAKTWSDLKAAFEKITAQAGMPAMANTDAEGTVLYPRPFMMGSDNLADAFWFDNAGDGYNMIMLDPETDTIQNYFATDEYEYMVKLADEWYRDGLIYKDAATAQDYGDTLVKNDVTYAEIRAAEIGTKESSEAITGYELLAINLAQSKIGTNSCTKFGYAVPVTSTEPEAAVKYLNYLYENGDVLNLLTWGVEGRDWVLDENGQASYPDGVTADNVIYHTADFLYGNQMLITPWQGSALDIREQQQNEMDTAEVSKYMGFSLNTEGLENTITACNNVRLRYHAGLDAGSTGNWEATLASFRTDLEAAGINDLIAAYQAQLDEWLADNA